MKNRLVLIRTSTALCALLGFIIFGTSCIPKLSGDYPVIGPVGTDTVPFAKNQLLLWKPVKTSEERFKQILDSLTLGSRDMQHFYCKNCDSSLVRLESPDIAAGLGPVGQLPSTGTGGGIGPAGDPEVYWSRNFNIKVNDFVKKKEVKYIQQSKVDVTYKGAPVVVAIFDTGLDPVEVSAYNADYVAVQDNCLQFPGSEKGWNFPDKNFDLKDDYMAPHGHGANVASIILEEVASIKEAPVQILPIKFISRATPNLFDAFCGMAYAKNRGANIINASFGYYSCLSTDPAHDGSLLFKNFLIQYTSEGPKKIIVVAAAGNKDDIQQPLCGTPTRSLDEINFFPASFAKDPEMSNIIVVTTVAKRLAGYLVSPKQNRSANVVDIGVIADKVFKDPWTGVKDIYAIKCPRMDNDYVEGSSYATPVVTGIIAAYYRQMESSADLGSKTRLMSFLRNKSVLKPPMNLASDIHFGLVKH